MIGMSFVQSIGYLKNGIEFLTSIRPILENYMKVLPDNIGQEVDELVKKDTKQEELKKVIPEKTQLLEKTVDEVFKQASAKVNIAKGILVSEGKTSISEAIPKISSARTMDKKIGWLLSFKSFIEENKDTLSRYPQLDVESLNKNIAEILSKKQERDSLEQERIRLTDEIENGSPKVIHNLVLWLNIAESILEMDGKMELLKQIPRQPSKRRKKDSTK